MNPDDEVEVLTDVDDRDQSVHENVRQFFKRAFDADVESYEEGADAYDLADKARNAVPFRTAIHLE